MTGIVKKFDPRGFGIIEDAEGLRVPFIRSDFAGPNDPAEGQPVIFSIRRVKDKFFADNIAVRRRALTAA